MKKINICADDLGFSHGVNDAIANMVVNGQLKNVGVMVNLEATCHGVELLKAYNVNFGLHTNICVGKPLVDPKLIPSLVDDQGNFKSSFVYHSSTIDFVVFEEVVIEIEAQLARFTTLFGRLPDYFEGHSIDSHNFFEGLEYVAQKYNLKYCQCR